MFSWFIVSSTQNGETSPAIVAVENAEIAPDSEHIVRVRATTLVSESESDTGSGPSESSSDYRNRYRN